MKVIGFEAKGGCAGIGAVRVLTNYGPVWIDPYSSFFAGRRDLISRREILKAVKAAPYGRVYYTSGVGSTCYDNTLLSAPSY
jgi:hypothetical protein